MTDASAPACGTDYSYTLGGKLATRTWARGAVTDYSYTPAGELALVNYADASTPDVAYTYDRLGRIAQVTDGSGTRTFSYDPTTLAQAAETLAMTGAPAPVTLTRNRDSIGRYTGYALTRSGETLTSATYGYDSIGHLATADNVTFSYEPQSDRIATLTHALADGRTLVSHTAVEANRGLIDYVSHTVKTPGQPDVLVSKYDYANNAIGQRTGVNRTGTAIGTEQVVSYGYDTLGQVTSAQSTVSAETSAYAYDPIGNRLTSTEGTAPAKAYAANNLNQYTTIEEQQQPFAPAYDLDGNMLDLKNQTGEWDMTWNGENRLVEMTKPDQHLVFAYDFMGRRWKKEVYTGTPGNWTLQSSHRYLYDGYVQITELDALDTYASTRSYRWDPTVGEATRVLSMTLHGINTQTLAFTHDGNKNTDGLVAADGTLVGHYAYGPFGQVIATTGSLASVNPFRFSSEFEDGECGLVYYNYRSYVPELGKWCNRDLIEEFGGSNLYRITANDFGIDMLGLNSFDMHYGMAFAVAFQATLNADSAEEFAIGSAYPDINPDYDAVEAGKRIGCKGLLIASAPLLVKLWTERDFNIQNYIHQLSGLSKDELLQRRCSIKLLMSREGDMFKKGVLAHAYVDTFGHMKLGEKNPQYPYYARQRYGNKYLNGDGAYAPPLGHMFDLSEPDRISNRAMFFTDAVLGMYDSFGVKGDDAQRRRSQINAAYDRVSNQARLAYNSDEPSVDDEVSANLGRIKSLLSAAGKMRFRDEVSKIKDESVITDERDLKMEEIFELLMK